MAKGFNLHLKNIHHNSGRGITNTFQTKKEICLMLEIMLSIFQMNASVTKNYSQEE